MPTGNLAYGQVFKIYRSKDGGFVEIREYNKRNAGPYRAKSLREKLLEEDREDPSKVGYTSIDE